MTSKEFIIWMKGFMEACNEYTATPKQWDRIREELYKVEDNNDKDADSTNYEPWYNPYQSDYRKTSGTAKTYNLNSNTATALRYPQGTSINYTNKKQQLND